MTVIRQILNDVRAGHRLTGEEALRLMKVRDRRIWDIALTADEIREQKVGNVVSYVRNQNLHVTNICKNVCGFCGFGRPKGSEGTFLYGEDEIRAQAALARERDVTEICMLSGVHPDFTLETYEDMIGWVHDAMPSADIHTASPDEVTWAAQKSGVSIEEALKRLRAAGLGTLQGTGAEILVDSVREIICPRKVDTATWAAVIRAAHKLGIRSTATIMYGSAEQPEDRIAHLSLLRQIQDETGGFTELVPLSYLHQNTALYNEGRAPAGATGREDLLLFAVSRLFLDNFDHIQISWGKVGIKMAQLGLCAGGDDLGGTMFCDAVSVDAGANEADYLDPKTMERIATDIGRELRQRTTTYTLL